MLATTLTITLSTATSQPTQPTLVLLPQFREPQLLQFNEIHPSAMADTTPRPAMHTLYWNAPDNTLYRAQDLPSPAVQVTYADWFDDDWFAYAPSTPPLVGHPAPTP